MRKKNIEQPDAPGVAVQQVVVPPRWKDYAWPKWIPKEVREDLTAFWSEDVGRSPAEWLANSKDEYNHQPALGQKITCKPLGRPSRPRTGRWVPMWNNIGRLICRSGVYIASTCEITMRHNDKLTQDARP